MNDALLGKGSHRRFQNFKSDYTWVLSYTEIITLIPDQRVALWFAGLWQFKTKLMAECHLKPHKKIPLKCSKSSDEYMRQNIKSSLTWIKAFRLFGALPYHQPVLAYFWLAPCDIIAAKCAKYKNFHLKDASENVGCKISIFGSASVYKAHTWWFLNILQ